MRTNIYKTKTNEKHVHKVANLFFFKYVFEIIELEAVKEFSYINIQTRVT